MAKKTKTIYPLTMQNILICIGSALAGIAAGVLLALGIIPEQFKLGIILLCVLCGLLTLLFGWLSIQRARLILTDKYVLMKTSLGSVIMQVPYSNIAQVRRHTVSSGEEDFEVAGIDVVKAKAKDTWWPRSEAVIFSNRLPERARALVYAA